ncbi:MAG: hypothetical protein IKL35_05260 [Muribaculaceae bacterium]|nr:hypothetical protein [Muribaculaceae bacterium]
MSRLITILLVLFSLVIVSCSSDNKGGVPSLSQEEIAITVGEHTTIIVNNAENVSASVSSSVVSVNVTDNYIGITALKAGECDVRITADGHRLQCSVVVVDDSQQEEEQEKPEEPEKEYDFSAELQDATSRYVSSELTITYGVGVLFSVENGNNISILDFDTGDNVDFRFEGNVAKGDLSNPQLKVNDNSIEITQAKVEQLNATGMWIHITTATNEHITLVITDL